MTILVKKPQIWGKIKPKTHHFWAKTRQKSRILMQNDPILAKNDDCKQAVLRAKPVKLVILVISQNRFRKPKTESFLG